MAMAIEGKAARNVPGNKVGAGIIWTAGAVMTYQFFDQITSVEGPGILLVAIVCQLVLTLAQGPVWRGRGGAIGYTALFIDAVINFGGVMFYLANIDQAGSVQAIMSSFFGMSGELPMIVKAVLALAIAAIVAGLPEYLWKLD
jgi:hypothetical protein